MKKIIVFVTSFLVMISFIAPLQALENHISVDQKKELFDFFNENQVDSETIEKLIAKVENGEILDSLNPKYQNDGVKVKIENGEKIIYPDGSIRVTTIERIDIPSVAIQPFSISGGIWQSGSSWWTHSGLKVQENMGSLKARFYMDCGGNAYGPSSISGVYDYVIDMVGGTWSNPKLTIQRKTATASEPAMARLQFSYNIYGVGSINRRVEGCVIGTKIYSQSSTF